MQTEPLYLDHAATTPLLAAAREALLEGLALWANPSSPHRYGRAARAGLEQARRQVAAALAAEPSQVVFTSGGTEADNLAVVGAALAARMAGRPMAVAVSAIEHKAILAAAHHVKALGGEEFILPVDRFGVDGAVLFADIMLPLEGMGVPFTPDPQWSGNWTAVEHGGIKVVFDDTLTRGSTYDLAADPDESRPQPLDAGRASLERYQTWRSAVAANRPAPASELSDAAKERLRAVGYMQ